MVTYLNHVFSGAGCDFKIDKSHSLYWLNTNLPTFGSECEYLADPFSTLNNSWGLDVSKRSVHSISYSVP